MSSASQRHLFDELYQEFSGKVYRLCLGYSCNHEVANDLMQECFVKIWQHLADFKGNAAVGTWIYRITVNTCLLYLKREKQSKLIHVGHEKLPETPHELSHDDPVGILYKAIAKLNEPDRLLISMVLEEVPYDQIAETLGITENNLRVKIHRVKKELQTLYKAYERI
jgi:RNA polymerase sigma factor (sigma-70 family)